MESARDPAILVRAAEADAKGLDPQTNSDLASIRIAAEQFEGLTRFNADGVAEPGLAQGWTISPDGLSWQFTLRTGLQMSDGTPIRASLFEQVFNRLNDEKTASPHSGLFDAIRSIRATGPLTVRIQLAHPFPALPELLAHPAMAALPLHRANWSDDRPLVTSGAYRTRDWALNEKLRLEANPRWHGGKPAFALVDWRPITDTLVGLRLFQSGGADILGEIPATRLPALRNAKSEELRIAPYFGSYYFAFNTRRPPFNDVRVRKALSLAVERDWISNSLIATGVKPAWGIVPPGVTGLVPYRPNWADWPRAKRLAEAGRLMKAAGYDPNRRLRFDIRFNSDTDHRRISVALAAMWRPLGVEASLLNSEASLHFASLRRADFALARSGWIGDMPVPENYLAVHQGKSGPVNYSGFSDGIYDERLEAALREANPARRAQAMRQAEARLMDATPILPLYYYVSKSMVSGRVAGWRDNSANIHPSRTMMPR